MHDINARNCTKIYKAVKNPTYEKIIDYTLNDLNRIQRKWKDKEYTRDEVNIDIWENTEKGYIVMISYNYIATNKQEYSSERTLVFRYGDLGNSSSIDVGWHRIDDYVAEVKPNLQAKGFDIKKVYGEKHVKLVPDR